MIDLQIVTEFMYENFEQVTPSKGGTHFLARCLLCGDSKKNKYKKRFNLDWNGGVPGWKCWNCGKNGNFIKIYSIVKGISYDDAKDFLLYKWKGKKRAKDFYKKSQRKVDNPKTKKEIDQTYYNFIKDKCISIYDEESRYVQALKKFYETRKIPYDYILYICAEGKYRNRIIIPVFNENGDIIYFQARRIPKTGLMPKYDNPATPKEIVILNEFLFRRDKNIIVFEGLIDAFMVENNQGTSCLGKEISEELIKKLIKMTDKDVILALDNDIEAYKALANTFKKNKFARKLKYFIYPAEFSMHDDINKIVRSSEKELNVYDLITLNSVSYESAYTKLKLKNVLGGI